ncbi:MAG: gamma-glutamyltransferase [Betaproteobacteria bacterium]|nr:gamma-glutamyltransferase [Betaproteobacteria bacterium]
MINPGRGTRGIAVAPHALAAQSALAVLREGGNAVEAMIAAAATIAVVYPHMNSIGGDAFWLIHVPGQPPRAIDACGAAAGEASLAWYAARGISHAASGINHAAGGISHAAGGINHAAGGTDHAAGGTDHPASGTHNSIPFRGGVAANTVAGTISGWQLAHEFSNGKLGGRLPLGRLLEDATHYAERGIPVTRSQHAITTAKLEGLKGQPGFDDTYLAGGIPPPVGSRFLQARLGATLRRLAEHGLDDFYRGELAQSLAEGLRAAGSPLAAADLRAHRAQWRTPLQLTHSLGTLYNLTPPTQGLVSLLILGILDELQIAKTDPHSAAYVHLCVEATKQAFGIRDRYITDPAAMTMDAQALLDPAQVRALAARIHRDKASPWGAGKGPADTVWMGAMDGEGRAVSFIQSTYHEYGSGVVAGETGVVWQNRGCSFSLDASALNALKPGRKPFHTLNPAMALLKDGRTLVYGNMGGDGQPQSQSAVFTRYAVFGMDPQAAVSAPRWLLGRTWGQTSDTLKLEARFQPEVVADLKAMGHDVEVLGEWDETMGHAGVLVRHPDGIFEGGADPRSDGSVAAF